MDYLKKSSHHVDVNSLLRGVMEGCPPDTPAIVSAIIGQRCELHWNVDDLFTRPGLRRERLLTAGSVDVLGGYAVPWRLYASTTATDSTLYGYRGQLLMRDFHSEWRRGGRQPSYLLDVGEETTYDIVVPWRRDDFHMRYRPYRRLISTDDVARYAALSDDDKMNINFAEFIQKQHAAAFRRDEIEPVVRTLTSDFCQVTSASTWNDALASPSLTARELLHDECKPTWHVANNTSTNARSPKWSTGYDQAPTTTNNCCRYVTSSDNHSQVDHVPVGVTIPLTADNLCPSETDFRQVNESCSVPAGVVNQPTARRRPVPPAVKPKPSIDLRRRQSAATNDVITETVTSLPVTRRQTSAPVDGSDSTPKVTVQFPTVDELFGRELAAIRRASMLLQGRTDAYSSSSPAETGCTMMASSATPADDVIADGCSAQAETTTVLVSDI